MFVYLSPPSSLLRSASFHGTEGMIGGTRWPRSAEGRYLTNNVNTYTSEDDGPMSYDEEVSSAVLLGCFLIVNPIQ